MNKTGCMRKFKIEFRDIPQQASKAYQSKLYKTAR